MRLHVARTHKEAKLPTRAYTNDVGWDLYTCTETVVQPNGITDVDCGIRVELPIGYWGLLIGRSSTSHRHGLLVVTATIDPDYTGPMFVQVINTTGEPKTIEVGQRLAQLVLVPVVGGVGGVAEIEESELERRTKGLTGRRNERGFGSSGN